MDLSQMIDLATGRDPVDLLLKGGRLVNVFSGEIKAVNIAIHGDRIIGFGDYDSKTTVDLKGKFVCPGFIDGHLHLESSMLAIPEFAKNVVPFGTTTVVADPHEIANVLGITGIKYVLDTSENLPVTVFIMFPSCVPATPFESSGAELGPRDMEPFVNHARVLGLAEMMNYPGVLFNDPSVLAKITVFKNKVLDGHSPGLVGKDLAAYVSAGIGSDHECTGLEEAREKLGMGMRIMIREGSAAKNLDALLPLVNEHNSRNCFFVTDDLEPADILEKGHLNSLIAKAIKKGLDPVTAIQMATINTARYFRLRDRGAIAPGYVADLVTLDDLSEVKVSSVYKNGVLTAQAGKVLVSRSEQISPNLPKTFNVNWDKIPGLQVKAEGSKINVIGVIPGQIVTKRLVESASIQDGYAVADPDRDILKIAVIERHHATGNYAVGFIKGFGLKRGAIVSTVAHDSHNIIVVGTNDADMMIAAKSIADLGGGMAVVENGKVTAKLPLPIAGLMSPAPINQVKDDLEGIVAAALSLGCTLENPFATLSFMALTPIPELKITDQGLFDSANFKFAKLFEE
jgi:adenine deaminase